MISISKTANSLLARQVRARVRVAVCTIIAKPATVKAINKWLKIRSAI